MKCNQINQSSSASNVKTENYEALKVIYSDEHNFLILLFAGVNLQFHLVIVF